jgi:TorA maturation chaperone TorD
LALLPLNRHQTYQLLSQLFTHGLTEEDLKVVGQVEGLAKSLADPFDEDEAAADHQHLFGFNLFPYESVFLDPSGQLGGDVAASTIHDYQRTSFDTGSAVVSPDHVGHELAFLSSLCRAETKASAERDVSQAALMQEYQRSFLDRHTLRWLPPLVKAMRDQRLPFYGALAAVTLETTVAHREILGGRPEMEFNLPDPPELLEDEKTGLKEIVAYLLTPALSGIYLGRDDISRLARGHSIPRGFGERRQMLASLLRSAANYGDLGQVLSSLKGLVIAWVNAYQDMATSSKPLSTATIWQQRASATAGMITHMRSRLAEIGQETSDFQDNNTVF